jgi:hypothetical protein
MAQEQPKASLHRQIPFLWVSKQAGDSDCTLLICNALLLCNQAKQQLIDKKFPKVTSLQVDNS